MSPAGQKPKLFGADYSVYTRIVRIALMEKRVEHAKMEKRMEHELVPVDIFASDGIPEWYLERQPFAKIPAFEHDGLRLFETGAITRYVDEAFSGPPLQPAGARERAVMTQIIGILDSYAYRTMVWDIYVERIGKKRDGGVTDEDRISAALPRARTCLAALAHLKRAGPWMLGDRPTLADFHMAPMLAYFLQAPEGREMFGGFAALEECWTSISGLASFDATRPGG